MGHTGQQQRPPVLPYRPNARQVSGNATPRMMSMTPPVPLPGQQFQPQMPGQCPAQSLAQWSMQGSVAGHVSPQVPPMQQKAPARQAPGHQQFQQEHVIQVQAVAHQGARANSKQSEQATQIQAVQAQVAPQVVRQSSGQKPQQQGQPQEALMSARGVFVADMPMSAREAPTNDAQLSARGPGLSIEVPIETRSSSKEGAEATNGVVGAVPDAVVSSVAPSNADPAVAQLQAQALALGALITERSDQLRVQQSVITNLRKELEEQSQIVVTTRAENETLKTENQRQAQLISELQPLASAAEPGRKQIEQLTKLTLDQGARIAELDPIAASVDAVQRENSEVSSKNKEHLRRIAELEARVKELYDELHPPPPEEEEPTLKLEGDKIDVFIQEFFNENPDSKISVTKVKDGWYSLGAPISQKVHLKLAGSDVVVYRVGGGTQPFGKYFKQLLADSKQAAMKEREKKATSAGPRSPRRDSLSSPRGSIRS